MRSCMREAKRRHLFLLSSLQSAAKLPQRDATQRYAMLRDSTRHDTMHSDFFSILVTPDQSRVSRRACGLVTRGYV